MRIILVQAEIEAALRSYVFSQINIAEGQDISIDFKNTRGDDGATAEINITQPVEGNVPQKATQPVKESIQATPVTKTAQSTMKASTASAAPVVATTSSTTSETEQSAEAASSTTENTDKTSDVKEPAEEEFKMPSFLTKKEDVKSEPNETAPAASGKSLFAGLSKPVNS